ncbi:MAG: NrfD/PsrC family molybdoenzyme membrane anchor subunit [Nitrososphaerales archaeon]
MAKHSPLFYGWLIFLLLLIGGGLGAWIIQLQNGLIVTGMRNVVSWGIYITLFAFFVGISAGGLIVSSSAHVFGVEEFKPIAKVATTLAAACVAVAALSIIPDLGRPERIAYLILYGNPLSPLIWDFTVIVVYLVLCIVDLWFMMRAELARKGSRLTFGFNDVSPKAVAKDERIVKVISFIALPTAVMLHTVTAWIFGTQISRSWWYSALIAPIFLASAMISGLSLVILTVLIMQWRSRIRVEVKTINTLGKLLAVIIPIDLFLIGNEFVIRLWSAAPSETLPLTLIFTGPFLPFFVYEWIPGAILPFILLLHPRLRMNPKILGLAALLVLTGVLSYRVELVVPGYIYPPILLPPGIAKGEYSVGLSSFDVYGVYFPTWIELTIGAALFGIIALITTIAYWIFPIWRTEKNINQ